MSASGQVGTDRVSLLGRVLCLFVFVSSVAPVTVREVRLGLLLFAVAVACAQYIRHGAQGRLTPIARHHLALVVIVGVYGSLLGFLHDTPGASETVRVWVLWPLLLGVAFLALRRERDFRAVYASLDLALVIVALIVLKLSFFGRAGLPSELIGSGSTTSTALKLQVTYPIVLSLSFLFPYGLARFATIDRAKRSVSRTVVWAGVGLGACATVAGGQRSALLGSAVGVVLILLPLRSGSRPTRRSTRVGFLATMVTALVVFQRYVGVDLVNIFANISDVNERSDTVRATQFDILFDEGALRWPTGWGFGHSVPDYVRSERNPWSYELTPLVVFMSVGFFGFVAYLHVATSLLRTLLASRANSLVLPVLAGAASLLLASSFNPATTKLGSLWGLFLAGAVANHVVENRRAAQRAPTNEIDRARSWVGGGFPRR